MAGLSLEYLQSLEGVVGGLATLVADPTSGAPTLAAAQIPTSLQSLTPAFKGIFANADGTSATSLQVLQPTGNLGDYAYVTSTSSFWYWNAGLATTDATSPYGIGTGPQWVNQQITATNYAEIVTGDAQNMVPYIIAVTAPVLG